MIAYYLDTNSNTYNYTTLQIPLVNPSGNCLVKKGMIKFIEDKKNTCSNSFIFEANSCTGFNSKRIFNKNSLTIIAGISDSDGEKRIRYLAEKVKFKKIQNRFYTYNIESSDLNIISKFERLPLEDTISECFCTNIITRVQYIFYINRTEIMDYETIYYVEDFKDRCNEKINIDLSYEINFQSYNKVNLYILLIYYYIII
jgi:hypothetical protein